MSQRTMSAWAGRGYGVDGPSVRLHHSFDDGQPKPQPASGPPQALLGLSERLESMREQVGGDASAGIA